MLELGKHTCLQEMCQKLNVQKFKGHGNDKTTMDALRCTHVHLTKDSKIYTKHLKRHLS